MRHVGAVGPSTSSALRRIWDGEIFVPSRFTTSALAEELPCVQGSSVIAFRSELAKDNMTSALIRRGAKRVVTVRAYSIRMTKDVILPEDHGLVLLGSPSAARCYLTLCNLSGCEPRPVICIGPVTSASAAEVGLAVLGVAEVQTVEGLVRKSHLILIASSGYRVAPHSSLYVFETIRTSTSTAPDNLSWTNLVISPTSLNSTFRARL